MSALIFLAGSAYILLGMAALAWIDHRTRGRGLAWVHGLVLLELAALFLWPLALLVHALDCVLDRLFGLLARVRS